MLRLHEIGGGTVRRRFSLGAENRHPGEKLTGDQIRALPAVNRQALLNQGFIEVWPATPAAATADDAAQRHIVNLGFGKFNVVAGVKINDAPLNKEQAETLAAEGVN